MISIKAHPTDKQIYFVNGKTVILNNTSFIASQKLESVEESIFREYLKTVRKEQLKKERINKEKLNYLKLCN